MVAGLTKAASATALLLQTPEILVAGPTTLCLFRAKQLATAQLKAPGYLVGR
jgi:hypothetical protein